MHRVLSDQVPERAIAFLESHIFLRGNYYLPKIEGFIKTLERALTLSLFLYH